jgi:hypothetical protein
MSRLHSALGYQSPEEFEQATTSEPTVDDFVAGRNPVKQQISTRFNSHGRNSLNHNKLKIGHLQPRAQCDLQTGSVIFVFNNLQGERLM